MPSDNLIRICVPLNEKTLSGLTVSTAKAAEVADLIEFRLDGLERGELEGSISRLSDLIAKTQRPVILTLRSDKEGGYRSFTLDQRIAFWDQLFDLNAAFFDIEGELVAEFTNRDENDQPDWSRVIGSYHDFKVVPANLNDIYEQLSFTPVRIVKVAVQANDITDCLEVFRLIERARNEDREIIAIAMSAAGVITRILGPSRGSFLTYGASEAERGTAPGQVVTTNLKSMYRIDQINADTLITGLVGLPVMHSVSPQLHNAAFRAANLNGVYLPFEVRDLGQFIQRMVNPESRELDWNLRGLSITAPHKENIIQYLDWIHPTAQSIGAVNTVVVENEQLHGYNTDADGLIEPLSKRLGSLSGLHAAVIGAGGAACAAVFSLQQQGMDVTLYARNLENADRLAGRFNISCNLLSATSSFAGYDLVINTTPLGSLGDNINETPVLANQLRGSRLAYDLVYNPIETRFLFEAREAGCDVLGGFEMLVAQAKLQFKIWTNTNVLSELMYEAGLSTLTKTSSLVS